MTHTKKFKMPNCIEVSRQEHGDIMHLSSGIPFNCDNGQGHFGFYQGPDPESYNEAIAIRIASCFSALSGIANPQAFVEAAKNLHKEIIEFSRHATLMTDELAEALTNFESALKGGQG